MAKHSIYLREEQENALEQRALKLGVTKDLALKLHLHALSERAKNEEILLRLEQLESRFAVLFSAMEWTLGELGYVSGASRHAMKKSDLVHAEADAHAQKFQRLWHGMTRQFETHSEGRP